MPDRSVLALLVVGLLLVPGPAYAVALDDLGGEDRYRSSAGYQAERIDASNDTLLTERYAIRLSFQPDDMQWRHVRADYRAPNQTRDVLDAAMQNGSASTTNASVTADLRAIERNYTLLTHEFDTYHAFSVDAAGETTTVTTSEANASEIGEMVRERLVVSYANMTAEERATFQKIRNATVSEGEYDYRPWRDEPLPPEPVVERNDTYYAVRHTSSTDDFGFPDGFFLGFVASGVGVLCLLAAAALWLYRRVRE